MGGKGSRILSGIGKVGSGILSGLNTGRDWIKQGYNTVKNIPVIGNFVDKALDTPLPLVGMSAKQIGGYADTGIDVANDVSNAITSLTRDIPGKRVRPTMPLPRPPRVGARPLPPLPT